MRQGFKAFVLIIIFGVPVFWYLFLQIFGTNQFELPTLGRVDSICMPTTLSVMIISPPETTEGQNQSRRIEQNNYTKDLLIKENSGCQFEDWDLMLVAADGQIKGAYLWQIAEIDRLLTEIELYHTIAERNGTSSKK